MFIINGIVIPSQGIVNPIEKFFGFESISTAIINYRG